VSQFMNVRPRDVLKIEKICYGFLWNNKPEQTKRAFLKNDKNNGGINGVDVESFLDAVKIRQFIKSSRGNPVMDTINRTCSNQTGIAFRARRALHKLLRMNESNLSDAEYERLARNNIYTVIGNNAKVLKLLDSYNIRSINDLMMCNMPRRNKNLVLKQVPDSIKPCTLANVLDVNNEPSYLTVANNTIVDLTKVSSSSIQSWLKKIYKKVINVSIGGLYNTFEDKYLEKLTFKKIWLLGYPKLIAIRLKLIHRNLFPNSRRFKAKLTDSPNCEICGEEETVEHMLFECENAKRLWILYGEICEGEVPDNLYDAIIFYEPVWIEIVKTLILKSLIGINRGSHLNIVKLRNLIDGYRRVETSSKNGPTVS